MSTYTTKVSEIEARQYDSDRPLVVVSEQFGEQRAVDGDYLIGTEKGKIYVIPKDEFEAKYELVQASPDVPPTVSIFRKNEDGSFAMIDLSEAKPGEELYKQHPDGSYSLILDRIPPQ